MVEGECLERGVAVTRHILGGGLLVVEGGHSGGSIAALDDLSLIVQLRFQDVDDVVGSVETLADDLTELFEFAGGR